MIAACTDRMQADGCAGCDKRDASAELMRRFGLIRDRRARPARPAPQRTPGPLLLMLNDIVTRIGREMMASAPPSPRPPSAFRRSVEREVEALLPAGGAPMAQVARALGCSRQTLYRRLRDEGESFERLVERVRRRIALRLLRDPKISVKEAGYRLGFAEPAAFSRAFKRWTGKSPAAWRAAQASG